MELEFHQLDRRYERLRASCPKRDGKVLSSLDRYGQQHPVVVVACEGGLYVLIDGYKRVRGLIKLHHDLVSAICWDLPERDALLLGRGMQSTEGGSALEQGWLLSELRDRFGLTVEELARRFDRSPSWVSGRLGLVSALPEPIQEEVRRGRLVPHAAMKFLLPLSRADRRGAIELAAAIAPLQPTTRQTEALCMAYARARGEARHRLLQHPTQFLRAREGAHDALPAGPGELLLGDIGALGGIARRARERLPKGAVRELLPPELQELGRRAAAAQGDVEQLMRELAKEIDDAGRAHQGNDSEAA